MTKPRCLLLALLLMSAASVAAAAPPLTPDGFGPLKIGMSERYAARYLGVKIAKDDGVNSVECREDDWPAQPNLVIMARNGRVSRISLVGKSKIRTDRGFGLGSREIDIERAYGAALAISPHTYDDPPAHYLTVWTIKGKRGVRFETDQHRRVVIVHVGDDAIEYVEGCL